MNITKRNSDPVRPTGRHAFTLIEVLVVMVVGTLLLGVGANMLTTARKSSRVARTRAIIAVLDQIINEKLEELQNRPLPINLAQPTDPRIVRIELTPPEAARSRLLMRRDLMRMELPDRFSDLIFDASRRPNQTNPPLYSEPLNITARARATFVDGQIEPLAYQVDWWEPVGLPPNHNIPGLLSAYRSRLPFDAAGFVQWTPQFASAECLYMIVSTTFMGGTSAVEMLPRGHIEDTDEDGVPEIVDSWGNPIGFIRWPVGYREPGATLPQNITEIMPEPYDMFRADFAYADGATAAASLPAAIQPRSLRPLIVSAGPDGVFDLRFSQTGSNGQDITYGVQTWPVNAVWVGPGNVDDRVSPFPYIDPFLRQTVNFGLIGEPLDEEGDGDEQRADNITNLNLAAEAS